MNKGDLLEFNNQQYEIVENNIVLEHKKRSMVIKLNVAALIFIIVAISLQIAIFVESTFTVGLQELLILFVIYIGFFVYVVVHELLHGFAFKVFGNVEKKDIKFGVVWKSAMAYCVSTVPVTVKASRLSLMMPVYVICIPMYVIGMFLDIQVLCITSILFLSGSVGDVYYLWKLRKANKDQYMLEMLPTKSGYEIGYLLLEKK